MRPTLSIIITGGNGSLGSFTAFQLAKDYPNKYHFLLTSRNLKDESVKETSEALEKLNATVTWVGLDLLSRSSVQAFIEKVKKLVADGEAPPLKGLINMAARSTYTVVPKSSDGFNVVYQTNVLSPFSLMTGLLSTFQKDGIIVNLSSSTHSIGRIDSFHDGREEQPLGTNTGIKGSLVQYGSSKLLLLMLGYEMQHRLRSLTPPSALQIVAFDPAGMNGKSRLSADTSLAMRAIRSFSGAISPVLRLFSNAIINPPQVPAQGISALFSWKSDIGGKFFIIDCEKDSTQLSHDIKKQQEVWDQTLADLKLTFDPLQTSSL